MKVRLKFTKTGALVYIGHLDVMRYFQKLFRRADIPVAYSEGFSPHQLLSFSHPLPLGMESLGEYADVVLTERITTAEALSRIKEQSVPEISVSSFKELPERCDNAMASVTAAKYDIFFEGDIPIDLEKAVDVLMQKDDITVTKKSKKSEKEVNIRPLIYELEALNKNTISTVISSGSVDNLKPEYVINALFDCLGATADPNGFMIRRVDQYTDNGGLISLDMIGQDIYE